MITLIVFVAIAVVFIGGSSILNKRKYLPLPENCNDDDIRMVAEQGQMIQAIRWHRELHGSGLAEAKTAVEKLIKRS